MLTQHIMLISFLFRVRTCIALRGKDGVVFAVENIITSKLYERSAYTAKGYKQSSQHRLFTVDNHVGMVASSCSYALPFFNG
jgi:20S proteasome alpha/beta subunit